MLYFANFDAIEIGDIERLVTDGVAEGSSLEFKVSLNISTDEEKREFLADVSAFANASGGDIVFGVSEASGKAVELKPISLQDPDASRQQIEQVIGANLDPRIPGVRTRWLPGNDQQGYLIIRVFQSSIAPHRITYKGSSRFFRRGEVRKYEMNTQQIRDIVLSVEGLERRILQFRQERVSNLLADESPVPLRPGPLCHVLVVPREMFALRSTVRTDTLNGFFMPVDGMGSIDYRRTLDGAVTFVPFDREGGTSAYTQIIRSGAVELVRFVGSRSGDKVVFADYINQSIKRSISAMKTVSLENGILGPFYLFCTLLGVRKFHNEF